MRQRLLGMALWIVSTLVSGLWGGTCFADPFPPELVRQGQRLYQQFCLYCHGPNMVNAGANAYDLRRFPRDQRERFDTAVTTGQGRMPGWGDVLTADELHALWAYVSTGGRP
jgi:mono/diheme cytochrome c family protein